MPGRADGFVFVIPAALKGKTARAEAAIDGAALKKGGVSIKEGSEYKFRITFRVQHEILPGLKYVNRLKRMGMKTAADELVIGSYAPQTEPHSFEFPRYDWLEAPKGMMYRGAYTASDKFVDGDGRTHLEYDYPVKVTK